MGIEGTSGRAAWNFTGFQAVRFFPLRFGQPAIFFTTPLGNINSTQRDIAKYCEVTEISSRVSKSPRDVKLLEEEVWMIVINRDKNLSPVGKFKVTENSVIVLQKDAPSDTVIFLKYLDRVMKLRESHLACR